jgi:hypothetical protein
MEVTTEARGGAKAQKGWGRHNQGRAHCHALNDGSGPDRGYFPDDLPWRPPYVRGGEPRASARPSATKLKRYGHASTSRPRGSPLGRQIGPGPAQ